MENNLNPQLEIRNYRIVIKNKRNVFVNIVMYVNNFLINFSNTITPNSKITFFLCDTLNHDKIEDIKKLKNFELTEDILNKYFKIRVGIDFKSIKLNEFDNNNYKKFILDNFNKAIMEYNL